MDLQQLINEATPGSIWMRTDGSRARVIAITNLSLPAESQQKYVPVVVYVGPSGKVFSRPLKDFAGYFPTWLGHDTGAEKMLNSLMTPLNAPKPEPVEVAEETEDDIDMSLDEPVAAPRAKPAVQVREKVESKVTITGTPEPITPNLMRAAFLIGNDESRKTPAATADQLSRALRVYSQVPDEHLGLVVHKLSFELSPNLTIDAIKEAFSPDEWVNTVDAFRIGTPVSDETVGVDAYIGVYPEFTRNVLYGTVYVGVDMVPVATIQSHTHEAVSQKETSASDEVPVQGPEGQAVEPVREAEPETVAVPASDPVEESSAEQIPEDQAAPAASEAVPGAEADVEVAQRDEDAASTATPSEVAPAESGESASDEEVPAPVVKPKAKRGRKPKKVVAPPPDDDTELDVETLS